MFKHTRGAGGGRVPRTLSAAGLYWSGTYTAAKSLDRYDSRDDEESKAKISASSTVPLSDTVRRNQEVEQVRSVDVGKVILRKGIGTNKQRQRSGALSELSNTLYVSNLAWTVNAHDLAKAFSAVGKVRSARVIDDIKTNQSRGFGFVEMDSREAASKAIGKLNGRYLNGRAIRVVPARSRKDQHASGSTFRRSKQWTANPDRQASDEGRIFWQGPKLQKRLGNNHQVAPPPKSSASDFPRGNESCKREDPRSAQAQHHPSGAKVRSSKAHHKKPKARPKPSLNALLGRKAKGGPEWKDTYRWQSDV